MGLYKKTEWPLQDNFQGAVLEEERTAENTLTSRPNIHEWIERSFVQTQVLE